jgi:putative DNA-binding protein
MSALADKQSRFLEALYAQTPCEPGFAIYRRNLFANLGGALAATYPVVMRLVGEAFFREAARRYILAVPSRSGDLGGYGGGFADFLADYPHASELPYLADVARLEWACHESYHAADAGSLDFAALARVDAADQARIRFSLHPAVRLVRSGYPVAAIWEANLPANDGTPARTEGADCAIVSRQGGAVAVQAVEPGCWALASAIARGLTLGEAAASLGEALPAHLARLVGGGMVAAFALAPAAP